MLLRSPARLTSDVTPQRVKFPRAPLFCPNASELWGAPSETLGDYLRVITGHAPVAATSTSRRYGATPLGTAYNGQRSSRAWKGRPPSLSLWIVVSTSTNGGRGLQEGGLN
jgi:hypothetical protein